MRLKHTLKNVFLGLLSIFPISNVNADVCKNETTTQGTDFWMAFLQNNNQELIIPHGLDLIISAEKETEIIIDNSLINDNTYQSHWKFSMEANSSRVITVPCQLFDVVESGKIVNQSIHVTSSEPISVYMDNHQNQSADVTLALPTSSCGTHYIIQNIEGGVVSKYNVFMPSIFSIVATENNTTVQITPSIKTNDGHAGRIPYRITLHQGQIYQVETSSTDAGLGFTGTQIESLNNKKIAVFTGNRMCNVPKSATTGNANNLFEIAYPVSTWGKRFIIQPFKSGYVDMVKVTASKNETKIYKSGKLLTTINALESYEFFANESNGAFTLETSEPVEVYQYMTSNNYIHKRSSGGPSSLYVTPVEQALNKITLNTSNNPNTLMHYINLVIRTKDASTIKFNGRTNFTKFTPIDDTYSVGTISVDNGQHTLESTSGFIANVYGFGDGTSYAYSAGSNTYDLNSSSNTEKIICLGDTIIFGDRKLTESGFYIDTLQNVKGCDSLTFLTLSVLEPDTIYYYDTIKVGESYNKNGFIYQTPLPGIYESTAGECPNLHHLKLVVEHNPCADGTLLFKEDFGGNKSADPVVNYDKIPQCSYTISADPRDLYLTGRYSIRKVSYPDKSWVNISDHTFADRKDRGYFMQCDASNSQMETPGTIYSVKIDDLSNDVPLYFSFWGLSMIKAGADSLYSDAKLKLVIEDTKGNVLRSKNIEMINGKETWGLYGMSYQLPESVTSAVFKILNNNTENYGNDFAIDDIEIRMCKTSVDVKVKENDPCIGSNLSLTADASSDVAYEWYYSPSSQIQSTDWILVGNGKNLVIPQMTEKDNGFYRVFVGDANSSNFINNHNPASDLIEVNVKRCFPPVCFSDTVTLSTCLAVDSMIAILDNDTISNRDNAILSLIKAPAYAKAVGNMLSYNLVDTKITADTVVYTVTLGDFADTASVIFKIDRPSKKINLDTAICSGSKYNELTLFNDTIIRDTTIMESGCPSIMIHNVSVTNIDASISDTFVCAGDDVTLAIKAKDQYKYSWYNDANEIYPISNDSTITVKPSTDVIYHIVASAGKCSIELTQNVSVLSKPYIEDIKNIDNCDLEIVANGGSGTYEYKLDQYWTSDNVIKKFVEGNTYKVAIKDDNGCQLDTTIQAPIFGIRIPKIVTSNGDGENDVFEIKNINKYPQTTIKIFDRNGVKVAEFKASESTYWDGKYNGHTAYKDDYWYEINIVELNKVIVGHFTFFGR